MADADPITSGLANLDYILDGGFAQNRSHLIEGHPGSGKTTLAVRFLIAGRDRGERCLFITMAESPLEMCHAAHTHGLSLDGIELFECTPPRLLLDPEQYQSVMHAADIELGETVRAIIAAVRASRPTLLVIDSLSELRLLAEGTVRFRRQVLALKQFFFEQGCTVLLLDDLTNVEDDLTLHSIAHGVVRLEQLAMEYGAERRRLRVIKMRGRAFRGGYHDFIISKGGLEIFPRHRTETAETALMANIQFSTGNSGIDLLLGGGLDAGTTSLIHGTTGTGKSTLALQCIHARLEQGQRAMFVSFEETLRNFQKRAAGLGLPITKYLASGALTFVNVDPAETSAGHLSNMISYHVADGAVSVVIDSLSGYRRALRDDNFMMLHMHELITFLNQQNVVTILVLSQTGLTGASSPTFDITYLADTLFLLRFFEAAGEMRRGLAVIKRRTGQHEQTMRELFFDSQGLQVGPPLKNFESVLVGGPVYTGDVAALLSARGAAAAA